MRPKVAKHKRKPRPWKAPTHCDMIRSLPCLLTGGPAECVHIRFADADHGKEVTGMQRRDDRYVLPLAPALHRLNNGCQHDSAEREWWRQFGIDPLAVAKLLWEHRDGRQKMERIVSHFLPVKPEIKARIAAILKGAK